jgi:hypothetical protein
VGHCVTREIVTAGEQLAGFYVVANLGFCTAISERAFLFVHSAVVSH